MTDKTVSDIVAVKLRKLRKERDWRPAQLAARCAELGDRRLTENAIENIESGRRDAAGRRRRAVTVDELFTLAQALDCFPGYLLPDQQPGVLEPGDGWSPAISAERLQETIAALQVFLSLAESRTSEGEA